MAGVERRHILAISEFLSSSDSSEDELLKAVIANEKQEVPRIENFITNVVDNYTDQQFKSHLRMSRETSIYLTTRFEQSRFYRNNRPNGKPIKTSRTHILSFLWYAGNKSVLRTVAERFDVSLSTLHAIVNRVLDFLLALAPELIKFPTTEAERLGLSNEFFEIAQFPGVIGCIDGTYINIRTPAHKVKSTYVNRHDQTAITLQAICDAKKKFIDVFTGPSSKIHDARIFKMSFIQEKVRSLGLNYHILEDATYPLSANVLTPYRDYGNLTAVQRHYNYKFCATRVQIENAFGVLKGRFRQLIRTDYWTVIRTSKFIIACCVLHNLCIDNDDFLDEIQLNDEVEINECIDYDANQRQAGQRKRDLIAANFEAARH